MRKRNGYRLIFKIVVCKRLGYGLIFKIVVRKRNVYGLIFKIVVRKRNGYGKVSNQDYGRTINSVQVCFTLLLYSQTLNQISKILSASTLQCQSQLHSTPLPHTLLPRNLPPPSAVGSQYKEVTPIIWRNGFDIFG